MGRFGRAPVLQQLKPARGSADADASQRRLNGRGFARISCGCQIAGRLIERQNDADRTYRVSYGELFAPMVKAIQEQQQENAVQQQKVTAQQQEIADLHHALEAQAAEIDALRHSIEALRQRVAAD